MKQVSIILFYDDEKNLMIQERKKHSKYGEEYGFFGGHIEKGETPEQTFKRELKEELCIDTNLIKNLKFMKKFIIKNKEHKVERELFVYLGKIPDLKDIKCREGKPFITNFDKIFDFAPVH